VRTGEVFTIDDMDALIECEVGNRDIHLEQHMSFEGVKLIEGDMMAQAQQEGQLSRSARSWGHWAGVPWPEGRVRYCFAPGSSFEAKDAFEAAIAHIKQQVPCIHFAEVEARDVNQCLELPSLMVDSPEETVCASYVGKVHLGKNVSQPLYLGEGCDIMGIAAHELGHALGLTHEQSRRDRSQHVKVIEKNIEDGHEDEFAVQPMLPTDTPYDMLSLMHYSATTFGKDGKYTLLPHKREMARYLGQRMGFSELDIGHLGNMYGCSDEVTPLVHNKELSEKLFEEVFAEISPITKQGCLCMQEPWQYAGRPSCATKENGFCCNPNEDAQGDWCYTEGDCYGATQDFCSPPPPRGPSG